MKLRFERNHPLVILWIPFVFLLLVTLIILPRTSIADDTEEVLLVRFSAEGRYGIVAEGQGMYSGTNPGPGTIEINVPGSAVVAAYLYWSGYADLGDGDDQVTLTRDGDSTSMEVTPDPVHGTHGPIDWYDNYYYYSYTADVTSLVVTGPESYTVSNFDGDMVRRNGAGLIVVYEDASLPINGVEIKDGIDRFYRGWGEGPRAESAVSCLEFAPRDMARQLELALFAAEVRRTSEEPDRPTALYYLTGTEADAQPADMVNAPTDGPITGNLVAGPPGPYPFASRDDPQWDTYLDQVTLPAGHSWACFQVESAQEGDLQPASGVWLLLAGVVEAVQPTDVAIVKVDDPDPVVPGEDLVYTLDYINYGPSAAENVVVSDLLPPEVTFVDANPDPVLGPNPLVWNLGTLAAGESGSITVTVTVQPWVTQTFTNPVTIITSTPETDYENNTDEEPTDVLLPVDVAIVKADNPDPVVPGEDLVYTLDYINYGPSDAENVVVSDLLPPEVAFVDADPAPASGPNPLVWNLGTLAAGESGSITVTVIVQPWVTQTFTNPVAITTSTPETDYENNTDEEPTDVLPRADVAIIKLDNPDPVRAGAELAYTLIYTNYGPSAAENVIVSDLLPPEVSFVEAYPNQDSGPNPLVWNLGTLAAGASGTIEVRVTVSIEATGTLTNGAVVATATPETDYSNNADDEPTVIEWPPVAVSLLYFRALPGGDRIVVEWETAWEQQNWGFNLYRGLSRSYREAAWIHTVLGQGGAFQGAYYRYADADIVPGQVYFYWLEDVETTGQVTRHGPIRVVATYQVFLPIVSK